MGWEANGGDVHMSSVPTAYGSVWDHGEAASPQIEERVYEDRFHTAKLLESESNSTSVNTKLYKYGLNQLWF
jgi:hypothetical protein